MTIRERGLIPTYASTGNAGFSCFGSPSELLSKALEMEQDEMWKLVAMTTDAIQKESEQFIRQYLLPATAFTITDRWIGITVMGTQKSPIIMAIGENVFCCVRMGGMGVALAPVAAQQVNELMSR